MGRERVEAIDNIRHSKTVLSYDRYGK